MRPFPNLQLFSISSDFLRSVPFFLSLPLSGYVSVHWQANFESGLHFERFWNGYSRRSWRRSASPTLISHEAVERYARLEPANPQLRGLHQDTIDRDLWRLLWMPAARPYYQPSGPFASASAKNFTKSLIFSSWLVVPRVIASVLSYEAEREMFTSYRRKSMNTSEARKNDALC